MNASSQDQPLSIDLQGISGIRSATLTWIHAATPEATNSITEPNLIHPVSKMLQISGSPWNHVVPALTIEVIDILLQ